VNRPSEWPSSTRAARTSARRSSVDPKVLSRMHVCHLQGDAVQQVGGEPGLLGSEFEELTRVDRRDDHPRVGVDDQRRRDGPPEEERGMPKEHLRFQERDDPVDARGMEQRDPHDAVDQEIGPAAEVAAAQDHGARLVRPAWESRQAVVEVLREEVL
jgi:hypothetical protein